MEAVVLHQEGVAVRQPLGHAVDGLADACDVGVLGVARRLDRHRRLQDDACVDDGLERRAGELHQQREGRGQVARVGAGDDRAAT